MQSHSSPNLRTAPGRGPNLGRRQMLKLAGLGLGGLALDFAPTSLPGASPAGASMPPLNRFPRMVQEYYVEQLRAGDARRREALAKLSSAAEVRAYQAGIRERIAACFGPFPEKTPLNARITGVLERPAFRIEKIIFESRPGLLVTANLYLPQGRPFPLPGVVGSCGHSDDGKANEAYQAFAQGLARQGFVVLIFDPLGQGERLQYPDAARKSRVGIGVREHLLAGNQQALVGEFFGAWRAWDGIRALDYLLSRPEVDPQQVGITGNSGGGTLTTWLCGLDPRWTMAAPGCFVSTFRRNLENELPADVEQCPPRALALGLEHEDILAVMAPKPVLILSKERDFFDICGTEEAFGRLRKLYSLLGAPHHIALFAGPTTHGYSKENREAMYRWFNRITGVSDATTEPALVLEREADLWCTPQGQVSELGSRTVFSFTSGQSRALATQRPHLAGRELCRAVSEILHLPPREGPAEYRILRSLSGRQYPLRHASVYALQTEPGIHALVYRLGTEAHEARPPRENRRAVLYVAHHSSDAELRANPLVRELFAAEPAAAWYACDVRGIGESRPDTCGQDSFASPYGSDYFYAVHALMLDRPYVGRKTHDLLSVLDWLAALGHAEIHLAATGWGTVPAVFAALLSPAVSQVTLRGAPAAYAQIAEAETYDWPLSTFIPGVLKHFDLPDCYQALAGMKLRRL